jgi:hypothetical protein
MFSPPETAEGEEAAETAAEVTLGSMVSGWAFS